MPFISSLLTLRPVGYLRRSNRSTEITGLPCVRWDARSEQSSLYGQSIQQLYRSQPGGVLRDHPKVRSRTSLEVLLRPTIRRPLEIARQYIANPDRCQRTTVSGPTMMRACFHSDQNLRTRTQKSLSRAASLGRACFRFSTASCWRRARFSSRSLRRVRRRRRIAPTNSRMASTILGCYRISPVDGNPVSC